MTNVSPVADIKAIAKVISSSFKRDGHTVPHNAVLNSLAAALDMRDWHILKAAVLGQSQSNTLLLSSSERGSKISNPMLSIDSAGQEKNNEYFLMINIAEVKNALFVVRKAKETKESISRKLCGSSSVVTVQDLANWEVALNDGTAALLTLTKKYPLLINHPYLHGFTIPA